MAQRDASVEKQAGLLTVVGIVGSLRQASFNHAAMRAAVTLMPPGSRLTPMTLDGIPPFNEDLEETPPDAVRHLKAAISAADAVLIATPEYNYSVPGVLKNAIDWASRPYGTSAWAGKPVGIMGASIGSLGTARAQYHLRQTFVFLDMYPVNDPEVMISHAQEKFDAQGRLTDPKTAAKIQELLAALVAWTKRVRAAP